MNIASRHFLHNHVNIAGEGAEVETMPYSNASKGFLQCRLFRVLMTITAVQKSEYSTLDLSVMVKGAYTHVTYHKYVKCN